MTGEWFDAAVATKARVRTRRASLAALAFALIGVTLGHGIPVNAGQATVSLSCRGKQSKCKRNGQCCSGSCRKRKGKKKGKCRCSGHLEPCHNAGDCCAINGNPQDCINGGCEL